MKMLNKLQLAPVVLFCYNRVKHLLKTLEALEKNKLADQTELYIFSDGPKANTSSSQLAAINEVRKVIKSQTWCKSTHIRLAPKNKGLAKSIIEGVTEIVNKHGTIIVLEDDLVTSPYFLSYMNKALRIYSEEEEVISIHGYTYPIKNLPPTYFLKGADCWGWATWKRGWDLFEQDGQKLLSQITNQNQVREFDFNNSYPFTKMLRKQVKGEVTSWAIRWYAAAFLKNKVTLYPGISFVKNIGVDGSGTHNKLGEQFNTNTLNYQSVIEKISIKEDLIAKRRISKWFWKQKVIKVLQKLNPFH